MQIQAHFTEKIMHMGKELCKEGTEVPRTEARESLRMRMQVYHCFYYLLWCGV